MKFVLIFVATPRQGEVKHSINPVNQKTSACGFHVEAYHQIWLTNLAERSNFTTHNIGNTNGLRAVHGHILHSDFIYAKGLGRISSCEEIFAF